jgi:hypothetical protein
MELPQQLDSGASASTPLFAEPLIALESIVVLEPRHGVPPLGPGTVIIGLMPPLFISVAPSGIAPPSSVRLEFPLGFDNGEAVLPEDSTCDDVQPEAEIVDGPDNPPPSNVEVVPAPLVPDRPEAPPLALQFVPVAGLKPPGSTSVAPSGRPVPIDPLDASEPNGDVGPIAGVLIAFCACPAPQLIKSAVVITSKRRIDTSGRRQHGPCAPGRPLN